MATSTIKYNTSNNITLTNTNAVGFGVSSANNPYVRWTKEGIIYQVVYSTNSDLIILQQSTDGGTSFTTIYSGYQKYLGSGSWRSSLPVYGYITTGQKEVNLFCNFPYDLPNGANVKINSIVGFIRHSLGGYLIGDGNGTNLLNYVSSVSYFSQQGLRIILNKTDGFEVTNNSVLCGTININLSW